MLIRRLKDCHEITAGDNSHLRELLHPDRGYPFTRRYSLAHATVEPGNHTLKHCLESSEVYYVIAGEAEMHVGKETARITVGDAVEIPAGSVQWLRNTGSEPFVFLCIVDPAWRPKDEQVVD